MNTEELLDLIELITSVHIVKIKASTTKVGEGETVVGKLNDTNKRLWHLFVEARNSLEVQANNLRIKQEAHQALHETAEVKKHDCAAFHAEMTLDLQTFERDSAHADLLKQVFWAAVRLQFPEILTKPQIGVREDFQVVWINSDKDEVPAGTHVVRITLEGPGSLGSLAEILRHRQ